MVLVPPGTMARLNAWLNDPEDPLWERPAPSAGQLRNDVIGTALAMVAGLLGVVLLKSMGVVYADEETWRAYVATAAMIAPLALRRRAPILALAIGSGLFLALSYLSFEASSQVAFQVSYFALAAVWAALSSLASRSEDLQNNTESVMGVIMVTMFVGLFAEGTWLTVASYVPIMSSVAMPVRLLGGDVPLWEPTASLLLTALTAYALLRFGERIYQRAVMQGGTALTWRQARALEQ